MFAPFTFPHLIHENWDGNIKYVFDGVLYFFSSSIFRILYFILCCIRICYLIRKVAGEMLTVLLAFQSFINAIYVFVYKYGAVFFYHSEFQMNHVFFLTENLWWFTLCVRAYQTVHTLNRGRILSYERKKIVFKS